MPTVPTQSVPSQVHSEEDEIPELPDVPSGDMDISTETVRKTKGSFLSLTNLKHLHMH